MSHATHANAALTPRARLRLAVLIVDQGWPIPRAAERYDVSWRTAKKWAERYRVEGPAGMLDRSSARHHQAHRTPPRVVRKIVALRWRQRLGPVEIGDRLAMPSSTVHAVLVRCRLNRLTHLDRATGEPIRRYEHEHPGDLLHVDVKKLGRVPDGGGWRYVGKRQGDRNRVATVARTGGPKNKNHQPLIGTCYLHTVIDDHSRVAYVEAHDDETKETATEVLRNAVAWFAARGVTVDEGPVRQRQLLQVPPMGPDLRRPGDHPEEDPALPAPDQRQDRTLPPHPGRGLGFQGVLRLRNSPTGCPARMAPRVQPPPAPLGHREAVTYHPVEQPGWASQLGRSRRGSVPDRARSRVTPHPVNQAGTASIVGGEPGRHGPRTGRGWRRRPDRRCSRPRRDRSWTSPRAPVERARTAVTVVI